MVRSLKRPSQRTVPVGISTSDWKKGAWEKVPADTALTSALRIAALPNMLGNFSYCVFSLERWWCVAGCVAASYIPCSID